MNHSVVTHTMAPLRKPAVAKKIVITSSDLPTKKSEDWRYLDVAGLAGTYTPAPGQLKIVTSDPRAVLVDDTLAPQRASSASKSANPKDGSVFEQLAAQSPVCSITITRPCTLTLEYATSQHQTLLSKNINIYVRPSVHARLVERCRSMEAIEADQLTAPGLTVSRTSIYLAADARLDHQVQQRGSGGSAIDTYRVNVGRNASYLYKSEPNVAGRNLLLTTLSRATLYIRLQGEHAQAHLRAARVAGGTQQTDTFVDITHAAAHTISTQDVRTVVREQARGSVGGSVHVLPSAVGASVDQQSKSLVLDATAAMFGKPQLDIKTDKVSARHGFTIGSVDLAGLFYLTSRGLPRPVARQQLIDAFITI